MGAQVLFHNGDAFTDKVRSLEHSVSVKDPADHR